MKAVLVRGYGDVNELFYGDTPDLKPGPGEVLVRMAATSINPVDWKLRRGDLKAFMPLRFPAILGRDLAGEVVGLGDGVKTRKIGERVLGLVNHSYAEYVLCKAEIWLSFLRALALSRRQHFLSWCLLDLNSSRRVSGQDQEKQY